MGVKRNNSQHHDGKDCVLGADVDPKKCTWCGQVLRQTIKTRASEGGTCRPNTYICAAGDGAIKDCSDHVTGDVSGKKLTVCDDANRTRIVDYVRGEDEKCMYTFALPLLRGKLKKKDCACILLIPYGLIHSGRGCKYHMQHAYSVRDVWKICNQTLFSDLNVSVSILGSFGRRNHTALDNRTSVPLENSSFPSGQPSRFPIPSDPNDSASIPTIMKVMTFMFLGVLTVLIVVVVVKRNEFCSKIQSPNDEDSKLPRLSPQHNLASIEVTVCSEPYPFFKTDSETIIYTDCAETPSKMMEYEALPTPLEVGDRKRVLSCESLSLSTLSFTAISIISQENLYEHTKHVIPQTDISINVRGKLGSGVEGLVLEGTYHGTHVACKTVQEELDTYLREGDLFFDVSQHPNICRFYGVTVFDGQVYLVSELFRDSSLRNVLRSGHCFSILEKVTWCRQLAAAVLHLHRHDVLHCDIALRNVLVDITSRKIALTDFGHARRVDGVNELETFAVRWTAPEVLKRGRFTKASDVYSFGITSIEILENGSTPFGDLSIQEVQSSVINNGLTPRISDKLDADMITIINNCLKNDAHNRTSSQELYDAWISYEKRIHKIKHHRRTLSVQEIDNNQDVVVAL